MRKLSLVDAYLVPDNGNFYISEIQDIQGTITVIH